MNSPIRNKNGQVVSGYPKLKKKEYGTGEFYSDDKRRPIPDYKKWISDGDDFGFDKNRTIDEDGNYTIRVILPCGTRLIRYGSPTGRFTAPINTGYEELSLPWDEQTCEYHEYTVIADNITVMCIVTKGFVAPGFESIGGGIQFRHDTTILRCINSGTLEEVKLWK